MAIFRNKIKTNLYTVVILYLLLIFLFSFNPNAVQGGGYFQASSYNVVFEIDHPERIESEKIEIRKIKDISDIKKFEKNIYIERFKLEDQAGNLIEDESIIIQTPYYVGNLASSYRYKLMTKNQNNSWFKLSVLADVARNSPGEYVGVVNLEGLEWEILVQVNIKPFVTLNLYDDELKLNIENPTVSQFFVTSETCELDIDSNHINWRIEGKLEKELTAENSKKRLQQQQIYFRKEKLDGNIILKEIKQEDFMQMEERGNTFIIDGNDYLRGKKVLRFGVELGENWPEFPAGKYKGTIIFTLIEGRN